MQEGCRFCEIGFGVQHNTEYNQPYLRCDQYFAVPSVGGFVEGWSLICPIDHVYNLRTQYGTRTFADFVQAVVRRISEKYSIPVMFEHGSSHRGSLTSCGTDHGHLHLVPLGFSLRHEIKKCGRLWMDQRASSLAKLPSNREYLFYSEDVLSDDPIGFVHILEQPTSQFFRRLIARAVGRVAESDYRQYPFLSLAAQSQQVLAASKG